MKMIDYWTTLIGSWQFNMGLQRYSSLEPNMYLFYHYRESRYGEETLTSRGGHLGWDISSISDGFRT
jgi:hypothetical protein